jgi:hypothetical protein
MSWFYKRPLGSTGDSLTDIGAMSSWRAAQAVFFIYACQREDGRMYRHPQIKLEHADHSQGVTGCEDHSCTFSRDHTISFLNYTLFFNDRTPLKRFWLFLLRHGFQHSNGTVGQRYQNLNTIMCILVVLYGFIGLFLWPFCAPALYIAARKQRIGYRLVMVAEICLLLRLALPKVWIPGLKQISATCFARQPVNTYYGAVAMLCGNKVDINSLYKQLLIYEAKGKDDSWLWSDPEDGRLGTGVDRAYVRWLLNKRV